MFAKCCLFLLVLGTIPAFISSTNPGLKIRVTPAGLDYATTVALDSLSRKMEGSSIPDFHGGSSGSTQYSLSNMRITSFIKPWSSISLDPPTGLRWTARRISLSISGNWWYRKPILWWSISDSGTFSSSVNRLSFSVAIALGSDTNGRPTIAPNGCSCDIDSVNIHFYGGWSWLYNLFKGFIGNKIRRALKGQMCYYINQAIDNDAADTLSEMPVTTDIADVFMLDYRMVSDPIFTSSYMESYHKAAMYWAGDTTEAPMTIQPFPPMEDTQRMLYLWVSDYLFNTFAYQAQTHGILTCNLTAENLPPSTRVALNTTCSTGFCIGKLIPQISMRYPNEQVDLRIESTRAPEITAVENSTKVLCGGLVSMYTSLSNESSEHLLTLNTSMNATIDLAVVNETIFARIRTLDFKLSVLNSTVGEVKVTALQFMVNSVLRVFVLPKLNDLGKNGFPLPTLGNIKFVNTSLRLVENSLMIATDVQHTG